MAKIIEVDEEEFLRNEKLRQEVATIWANPEAKKLIQRAQKLVNPKAVTPDLDRDEQDDAKIQGVTKALDEMKQLMADQKAENERREKLDTVSKAVEAEWSELRSEGWTPDGIAGVQKIMEEKGLYPRDASILFERRNPPQAPISTGASSFFDIVNPQDNDDFLKAMMASKGESDGAVSKKVAETLGELRGQPRR